MCVRILEGMFSIIKAIHLNETSNYQNLMKHQIIRISNWVNDVNMELALNTIIVDDIKMILSQNIL